MRRLVVVLVLLMLLVTNIAPAGAEQTIDRLPDATPGSVPAIIAVPSDVRLIFSSSNRDASLLGRSLYRLTPTGVMPVPIPGVASADMPSLSRDGRNLAFISGGNLYVADINPIDGVVSSVRRLTTSASAQTPAWQPHGRLVAYGCGFNQDTALTTPSEIRWVQPGGDLYPSWHPDGQRLVYATQRHGVVQVHIAKVAPDGTQMDDAWVRTTVKDANGAPTDQLMHSSDPDWSPDGQRLVFQCAAHLTNSNRQELCTLGITDILAGTTYNSGNAYRAVTNESHNHAGPAWDGDGCHVSFSFHPRLPASDENLSRVDTCSPTHAEEPLTFEQGVFDRWPTSWSLMPTNQPPTANAGGPYNGSEGSAVAMSGATASDPDGDTLTYNWIVNTTICSFNDASLLNPNLTCSDNGSFTATLTTNDGVNPPVPSPANVTINNVAPANISLSLGPTTINENGSVTLSGSFTDPGILDAHTVVITWGDLSSDTITLAANVLNFGSITHQYLDDGPYPGNGTTFDVNSVKVTVTDKDGGIEPTPATTVIVNNVAPALTSVTGPIEPIALGTPDATVTVTASFNDVGSNDGHTCTFAWDDDTPDSTITAAGTGNGSCTASHTYVTAGVNTIGVTVTDDDLGSTTSKWEFAVIYDPGAGFVTGGGWITSIAGSYKLNPALTGKANFGFVSKYQKGANVPTGNTEFQFKVASFNFHSENYQWLIVAGCKAQYKGTGTVNGSGSYTFLLTGYDAQAGANGSCGGQSVDRFRIKITDSSDGLVYDNNPDGSEDIDAADPQALGGGSIVVHSE